MGVKEMTGIERLRELADAAIGSVWANTSSSYREQYGLSFSNEGGGLDYFLADIADQIEAETQPKSDPAADVSMSAYDLLPEDEREAIAWVREHGGLERVKGLLDWVVGYCSTRQQLDFDFWLSGRVMHELGFEEDVADRDEVERRLLARLMPKGMCWPVYEDGELVSIGDKAIIVGKSCAVSSINFSDHCWTIAGGGGHEKIGYGERFKRPAPKVLDADGVEIRAGETLYHVGNYDSVTVRQLIPPDKFEDTEFVRHFVSEYTHRAPVLAADGKPLREGETVWSAATGASYTVKKIGDGLVPIECDGVMGCPAHLHPSQLTHERPDSWDLLAKDVERLRQTIATEFGDYELDEGGSVQSSVIDLVRRAKALAERDA